MRTKLRPAVAKRDDSRPPVDEVHSAERKRLAQCTTHDLAWKKWGPYLSERQWGTVREDYSANGDAWSYFTHDQARSRAYRWGEDGNAWGYFTHDHAQYRAYRWGEDGLGGLCDDKQRLCFALALWNGCDPILKERMFGLTNSEGNHGEDVKECYYYLDGTPTASYSKSCFP